MQTAGFGRKGAPAGGMPTPSPLSFGGRVADSPPAMTAEEAEIARRREAFLASERQRVGAPPEIGETRAAPGYAPAIGTIYARPKSMMMAYLMWFLLGAMGAHRFYLGRMTSGGIQFGLWVVNIALMLSMNPLSMVTLVAAGVWIIGDAFLIPGMVRATEAAKPGQVAHTFA